MSGLSASNMASLQDKLNSDEKQDSIVDDKLSPISPDANHPNPIYSEVTAEMAAAAGYKVYWQRWLMLFTFCMLSMSNGMAWLTYATNANAAAYYNVTYLQINMMAVIYEIIYVALSLFAGRMTQKLGLRGGMFAGAALNMAGAIIRVLPWPFINPVDNQSLSYGLAVFGQICCGSAQLFTLATPVLIADNWFPAHERVTATGIGALSNQVGLALAFATAQIVLPGDYSADPVSTPLVNYIICHGVIMVLASLSVFIFFRSKPPTPPSLSQDVTVVTEEDYDLLHVLRSCLTNFNLWLLLLAFGAAQGTSYAVATLLNSFMTDQSYAYQDINVAGVVLTIGGVLSPALFGYLADKTRAYKALILASMISTTIFSITMPLIDFLPHNAAVIQLFAFLLGFCMASIIPLALDVSVEVTYPLPPAVTSTLCMIASNGAGLILTFVLPEIQLLQSDLFAGWTIVVYMGVSTLLFLPFNARSHRLDTEARALVTRVFVGEA